MNDAQLYTEAMPYEWFIRNAHKLIQRQSRLGADVSFMHNLLRAEAGSSLGRGYNYDKRFEAVQKHMTRALEKYQKWKLTAEERSAFLDLVDDVDRAMRARQLLAVVERGLELTARFRS